MGYISAIVRMKDKMNRVKALLTVSDKAKVSNESISDTLLELANYSLMLMTEYELRENETSESL